MLLTRNVIAAGAGSSPSMSANTSTGCGCTCPACSGLQSFCRPRFFAGQLLTDKDLNCLENYLVNKNKLHNRYLVGWGVACGMQVMCSPCQGMVTVKAGYAVSPCGEDIVVPCDATVDICSLISQCNAPPTNTNCPPMRQYPQVQCNNMPVTWLLTIRYIETPSRGITPLSNSSSCQCGASTTTCSNCGSKTSASGGCGCGCGSGSASAVPSTGCCGSSATGYQATASTNGTTVIPGTQNQCQPTQLCEGYVFELCPAPSELTRKQMCPTTNGPLAAACLCLQNMVTGIPAAPGPNANQTEKYNWLCELQNYLYNLLASIDLHDCSLFQTLGMITIPTPGEEQFNELYVLALGRLRTLLKDQIYNCICLALLPPCPATVCDDRVVLATVTVSGSGGACQVTDVCNFSNRNFLVTMETLAYWFGDVTPLIKKAFAGLCCRPDKTTGRGKLQQDPLDGAAQQSAAAPSAGSSGASPAPGGGAAPQVDPQPVNNVSAADPGHIKALSTAMAQSFLDPSANISLDALVAQALGLQQDNAGTVTPAQAADPVHYMLANFVLGPAAQSVFPDMSQVKRDTATQAPAPSRTEAARDLELTQVQSQVAELTATVQRQDEMINQLLGLVKSQQ